MSITVVDSGEPYEGNAEVPTTPWVVDPGTGGLVTTPQGGAPELAQSVQLALLTRRGERRSSPDYGSSNWLHAQHVNASDVAREINAVEPRAAVQVDVQPAGARWNINVVVNGEEL